MRGISTALFSILACACAGSAGPSSAPAATEATEDVSAASPATGARAPTTAAGSDAEELGDTGTIPHYRDGEEVRRVNRATAAREGLTVLQLGDEWTPNIFREDESLGDRGRQPYRPHFIRLANGDNAGARRDPSKAYLELFGIFPTFDVLRQRLADEERHACHDAVDDAPIAALTRALRPGADIRAQRRRANASRLLRRRLEEVVASRGLASIDELESDRRHGRDLRRLRALDEDLAAVRAVQAHLRCEGYLHSRADDGVLDGWTGRALRAWQSKHMLVSLASQLDEATRATLVMDSRELDFLSLLRALRERVANATGIIEDGTASGEFGTVLGRELEVDDEFRWSARLDPLEHGAPDLLSAATEAAARALGWTDPAAALAWLNAHHAERTPTNLVALPLPPRPAYHSEHMELRAEIDRGDVWYAFPYTEDGRPRGGAVRNRPLFVIYARHEGRDIPLVRWNTTIGGWQPEVNPAGGVGLRYKESDVGERVWRDIIAGPAWLPPPSTPDDELLRRASGGGWRVHTSITGPGYDSAYGLAMVVHHLQRGDGDAEEDWIDRGIRSHGSVSYRSILRGQSHGCHRLFNHLAVRMTSFLLAHRNHVVHGRVPANLRRELHPEPAEGAEAAAPAEPLVLEIDTRGYRFELTPPVPVEVLRGNVRGAQSRPLTGFYPLPEELQAAAEAAAAADEGGSAGATTAPAGTPVAPTATP